MQGSQLLVVDVFTRLYMMRLLIQNWFYRPTDKAWFCLTSNVNSQNEGLGVQKIHVLDFVI
mgnify:CR=1 FL=1